MATEDHPKQPKERGERLFSSNDWTGCSVIALLITASNAHNYPNGGAAAMLGRFIGSLAVVAMIWVIARGIYRWIKKKRPIA